MASEDDDRPRKKVSHEIGQDLSLLSVEELTERIALLKTEIERLQDAADQKARLEGCGEQLFQVVARRRPRVPRRGPIAVCSSEPVPDVFVNHRARGDGPRLRRATAHASCRRTRPMADMANEP